MRIELKDVKLDENWVPPSVLADELAVVRSTVTNWIKRDAIDYIVLPGVQRRKHLVDKRTSPGKRQRGAPTKKAK